MKPEANSWNDDRLDELSRQTEKGFDEVKGEIKDVRQELHRLNNTLLLASVGVIGTLLATGIFG